MLNNIVARGNTITLYEVYSQMFQEFFTFVYYDCGEGLYLITVNKGTANSAHCYAGDIVRLIIKGDCNNPKEVFQAIIENTGKADRLIFYASKNAFYEDSISIIKDDKEYTYEYWLRPNYKRT